MNYKPCTHCYHKKACEKYASIRTSMHSSGLSKITTSINFRCDDKHKGLEPGTRVSVTMTEYVVGRVWEHVEEGMGLWRDEIVEGDVVTLKGTIMSWDRGKKVRVWLDEPIAFGDRLSVRVRVYPDRLTLLDEPPIEVCEGCGVPEGKVNDEGWSCDVCKPYRLNAGGL